MLDIPEELMDSHDLTVDYILTPTRVIKTNCQLPKPQGIIWTKVHKKNKQFLILDPLRSMSDDNILWIILHINSHEAH